MYQFCLRKAELV